MSGIKVINCPACGGRNDEEPVVREAAVQIHGHTVKYKEKVFVCPCCKEAYATAEMLDENLAAVKQALTALKGGAGTEKDPTA